MTLPVIRCDGAGYPASTRTSLPLCGLMARASNVLILTFYMVSGC